MSKMLLNLYGSLMIESNIHPCMYKCGVKLLFFAYYMITGPWAAGIRILHYKG